MKIKRIVAALAITVSVVIPASAQNLNSMAQLACEATLCLSTGQPPHECSRSLQKYFSITLSKPWKTAQARGNFLKLCPDVKEADAQKVATQSLTDSEREELAKSPDVEVMENEEQPVSEVGQPPDDQIRAALDSLTPVYNSQQQQSASALRVLEKCVAQQGPLTSGACQAEKADFDAKRLPAITLRDEIARLEAMLPEGER